MSHQLTSSEFASKRNPLYPIAAGMMDRAKWSAGAGKDRQECGSRRHSTGTARAKAALYRCALMLAVLAGLLSWTGPAQAQVRVTTEHNDNSRTGANTQETVLTTGNVNPTQFGKLYSAVVDGFIYAQPLYLYHVSISGVFHNVVYVATEHDSVYAFDADTGSQLWHVSFINPPTVTTVSPADAGAPYDLVPEIGITSTPVIDPTAGTLYVIAKTKESGVFVQRLHALNVATGAEKSGSPVVITASVSGTGDGSVSGTIAFDPLREHSRPGLLLENGHLVIAWASHEDVSPFHGWVMSYNPTTLAQEAVYNTTPNGGLGGIWMSGSGLAADSNYLYFSTGNGTYDGTTDFGDSSMKLGQPASGSFPIVDWFTPFDQSNLNANDLDLGSGGVVLLPDQPTGSPHQHLLLTASKAGTIYLLDRDNMGHFNASNNNQVVQSIPAALPALFGAPAWWNNTAYFGGSGAFGQPGDFLKAFHFDPVSGILISPPATESSTNFQYPGPTPAVSSNGTMNGIVWAIQTDQFNNPGQAVLHAFDATNLATELYNTSVNPARDNPGFAVKFTVPTVANGKVFVGSQTQLSVYGLLNPPALVSIAVTPANPSIAKGATQQFIATGTYSDSSTQVLTGFATWNSTNTAAATIVDGGLATGVAAGNTTIQATYNSITGSTVLTVNPPSLVSIAVTPANPSILTGGTQQFTATGTYSDNSTQNLTSSVTWTSNNNTVATINSAGLASGVGPGSATIQATLSSIVGSTTLTDSGAVSGVVGHWPFDASSGTTAVDISGNGYNATMPNGITWVTGVISGAISANNTNQFASTPSINLTGTHAVTVSMWVNRTYTAGGANGSVLFEFSNNYNNGTGTFGFFPDEAADCGTSAMEIGIHGDAGYNVKCFPQPTSGVWHHLATVLDVTQTGANEVNLYVDGVLQTALSQSYNSNNTAAFGNFPLYLFSRAGTSSFAGGEMDDLQLYSRALSASEIQAIHNSIPPDFVVGSTPTTQTVVQGNSTTFTPTVTGTGGFSGSVIFDVGGLPAGVTGTFNPTSVTGTGSSTLTVTTSPTTPTGTYPVTITGISGNLVHSATVNLVVSSLPNFTLSLSPALRTVIQGSGTTYTSTVTALGGFTGSVALAVSGLPTGANGTFVPTSVTGSGSSTLTITTAATTPAGTYTLTVTGTSGALVHTATTTFVVNPPAPLGAVDIQNGTVSACNAPAQSCTGFIHGTIPAGEAIMIIGSWGGATTTATINDGVNTYTTVAGPLNAAVGPNRTQVWLATNNPGGVTQATITLSAPSSVTEVQLWVIPLQGIATVSPVDANVTHFTAGTGTSMTTGTSGVASATANEMIWGVFEEDNYSTPYTAGSGYTSISGQEAVSLLEFKNVTQTGVQTATGTNGVGVNNWIGLIFGLKTTGVGVTPTLSSIAVTPATPSVVAGGTQQFTATGINSDNSTQDLTSVATWTSVTTGVATIASGGLATGVAAGTSTIQATYGLVTGSTVLTVTPAQNPDFTISATPASRSILQGAGTTYSATVTGMNAFSGSVNLSVSGLPAGATGTFNPSLVVGSGPSTLTITTTPTTPTGSFTLTITGTSGALTHSTTTTLVILNPSGPTLLTISVTPASPSLPVGATQAFTATGNYSDSSTQNLTGSVVWSSTKPATATISSGGVATGVALGSTTIQATSGAVVGSSNLTISTALSGTTGHWGFDDGTGTTAADSSGNGYNATLFNGVSWISGLFNGAISANNVNQYASTPSIDLTGTHAVTVSLWVNRTYTSGGTTGTTLFEFSSNLNSNIGSFGFYPDEAPDCGTPAMEIGMHGDAGVNIKCFAQPSSGAWHHLAVVYDVTQTAANEVSLYIDGVLQTALSQSHSSANTAAFGNFPLYLFSRGGTGSFSGGEMDELQLYSRALSSTEVQELYNERLTIPVGASVSPTSLAFGNQSVNVTSAPKSVILTSIGANALTISNITTSGDFALASSTCTALPMPTAATCTMNVTFTPTVAGARSGSLTITSNDPNSPLIVPLSGTGVVSSAASVSPTSLNFGKQGMTTTSATLPVNLTSVGVNPLNLSDIQVTGDFNFPSSTCTAEPMTTGVGCTMNVTFTPTAAGTRTGSLIISSDDPSSPAIITLSGSGVTTQAAAISATSLAFGNQGVGTTSVPVTVTLSSVGSSALTLTDIQTTGDFAFPSSTCTAEPMTNSVGCTMSVTFTPTASGPRTGTLIISSDDPSSPLVVALSGTGVTTAAASVTPTSLAFGKQGVGTTSSIMSVTLTSVGANPLLISNITTSGDFGFPSSTCTGNPMSAGATCTLNVTFTPTAAGNRTGSLTITTNDPSSPLIVSLTGTGVTTAAASATPAFPVFGRQGVGITSSPVTVTVSSVGATPLVISNTIVGGDFAILTNTCTSAPMAPSATCTITATFTPSAAGATGGAIVVSSNDPGSPLIIPMTGTGVTTAAALVTPVSPTFASQTVNTTSSPLVLTLSSVGATPLTISDILVGGDFAFVSSTCTALPMAPSTSCTLNVTFTPTATGTRTGSMVITTNDPASPLIVPLSGTGN
ncbi:MAG: choice-of-anchor D domain-containing protein [Acidobacteriia bacterium]|nr:choice-of-anchor D domain-containing protein [Terriglobia bacterium]